MLSLSPPLFTTLGWSLEESIAISQNDQFSYFSRETLPSPTSTGSGNFKSKDQQDFLLESDHQSFDSSSDPNMSKKLNHNASERDRRKKMNNLYSSIRSLLPLSDKSKKLSIPATISRVLKYIPELQQQLERLTERKEELQMKISKQDHFINPQINQRKCVNNTSSLAVSTNHIGYKEAVIHISICNNVSHTTLMSEILMLLEEEHLLLNNCSSFESFCGRVFYDLHVQVEGMYPIESDSLREKIAYFCDNKEVLFQ